LKERYRAGSIGDVEVKKRLSVALNQYMNPIRERRKLYEHEKGLVEEIVYEGTLKMQEIANQTLNEVKSAMGFKGMWSKINRIAKERKNGH
jgi:tryptophanyl-tRNA synthetase